MKAKGEVLLLKILAPILLFVLPSFISSSERLSMELNRRADISNICYHTSNPPFCLQALNSVPGAADVDLSNLTQSIIKLAHKNATSDLDLVRLLLQDTTDLQLKERYTDCLDLYDDTIQNLEEADDNLNGRDYNGVCAEASAALDDAADCADGFQGLPADPSLAKRSRELQDICSILLVISNFLLQQRP